MIPSRHMIIASFAFLSLTTAFVIAAPAATAVGTLDQDNLSAASQGGFVVDISQSIGQTFTAGISGALTNVSLYLGLNAPSTSFTAAIYAADVNSLPTGTALATQTVSTTGLSAWSNPGTLITFSFDTPTTLVSGTKYSLVLSSSVGDIAVGYGVGGSYSNGISTTESSVSPGVWTDNNHDLRFATYVTVDGGSNGSPADVLQQFGRGATGSCADSNSTSLNWGGAASGGWGDSWAQWVNSGAGGYVCTRTLKYSNALRHWVVS